MQVVGRGSLTRRGARCAVGRALVEADGWERETNQHFSSRPFLNPFKSSYCLKLILQTEF